MGNSSAWPSWGTWHFNGLSLLVVIAAMAAYFLWRKRLNTEQKIFGLVGVLCAILLLSSDVQTLSMTSYPCHMIEHLIVVFVIAPLLARTSSRTLSRSMTTLGFFALTVLVPLYHLTSVGAWVMQHPGGHYVELLSFLIVGVWFWLPVYSLHHTLSDIQRVTYTLLALPVITTTGLVLWSASSSSLRSVGMHMMMVTIGDVRNGGVVMMLWGSVLLGVHILTLSFSAALRQITARTPVGLRYA
jgi:cytochrome c oxidase assembly factor CtaG